jgi:N-acetylmuramoyl-L-alanine amidase
LKRYLVIFVLLSFAWQLQAQQLATGVRAYTLDETMGILYTATGKGQEEFRWDPFFQEGSFSIAGHYGAFNTAFQAGVSGFFMLDNRDIYPVPLPYTASGELIFPELFVQTVRDAFTQSIQEDESHYRIAAIIIDPGHGGKDSGAVGKHTINGKEQEIKEKDIVLKASKQLRDMLTRAYPDKRILMTRESDITLTLEERTLIANAVPIRKNEAIIYISIHANASRDKNAKGYEVWHIKPDYRRTLLDETHFPESPELRQIMNLLTEEAYIMESIRIASSILDSIGDTMGRSMVSRGLKEENWFVVRLSHMPAVLVELGFVSNKDDALIMASDTGLNKLVDALYKGIARFVVDFERSGGFIASR